MRITLSIDDDVHASARAIAQAKAQTLDRVISDLVRRGLQTMPHEVQKARSGFPTFNTSANARLITLEDVRKLDDDG